VLGALERHPARLQRLAVRRQARLAGRPDRPRRRAAIEKAAKDAGHDVTVPSRPGRTDATAEMTDVESFAGPRAQGRRLPQVRSTTGGQAAAGAALVDKANLLRLTAPEMTVLVGGLRVLGANHGGSRTACSPTARAR
jgi:catalase (peroxidase I)